MNRPRYIFKTVIAPIVVTIAIVPTFAIALWELLHGRGAATYTNVFGLTIHYTSRQQMNSSVPPPTVRLTNGSGDRGVSSPVSQGGSR